MKRITIAFALLIALALAVAAFAQGNTPGAKRGAARAKCAAAVQQLGLSKEQVTKIGQIVKDYRADVRDAIKSEGTAETKKAKVQTLRDQAITALGGVLTADQMEKARQMGLIEKVLSPRKFHRGHARRALWVSKQLNLSDQQKADIKSIMQGSRTQGKAIFSDTTLSKEAKRAKLQQLRQDTFAKIKALLTPEQQQKIEELKKNRPQPKVRQAR